MAQINDDYLKLPGSYLFADIAHKVNAFKENHPEMELIRLGIGDVTRPLPPSVIKALHKAVDEQATAEGFRGYGPEQGYRFLREAIAQGDFASRGVEIDPDDIFVSDGAKCDLGNFQELFGRGNVIAVTDPVYPVYVDSNVMGGRAGTFDGKGSWSGIVYLPCSAENGFVPSLPLKRPDVIYLCLPNNPTGTALSRPELQRWVDYARSNQCLILFDAAYEAYIREDGIPHSIYELEGAKEVAVEFRSFSKPAGFTGLRCGYVVVPETVKARAPMVGCCPSSRCGTAARQPSTTVAPTSFSAPPKPSIHPKGGRMYATMWAITWKTPRPSVAGCKRRDWTFTGG